MLGIVIPGDVLTSNTASPSDALQRVSTASPAAFGGQNGIAAAPRLARDGVTPAPKSPIIPEVLKPLQSELLATEEMPVVSVERHTSLAQNEAVQPPAPRATLQVQTVPLPVPRPPEFRDSTASVPSRRSGRSDSRRAFAATPPATTEDNRSFLEKLFGIEQSPKPALAYAALQSNTLDMPRARLSTLPNPSVGAGTAVYDITARVVTLPNGERLEAHSGLGDSMDNPRYVNLRMRGSTPPGTYELTEREQPFHGVRALRLNPIGGSAAIHGRTGLLAHTYLLGPSGASNGCVSFKNYDRFLEAYLRGEVQRLVVVPGQGLDVLPVIAENRVRPIERSSRRSSNVKIATLP
ncbi:DUF2778 domain-containing protein [Methylobacterium iners]